jgi:histidyl-tRNA synthetase
MIKAVRGTRDLLPPETGLWNFVEAEVRDVFRAYNFLEIRTPIFEATELFARSVGEETDIVSKEMYSFEDRPGELPDFRSGSFDFAQAVADVTKLFETDQIPRSDWNRALLAFLKKDLEQISAVHNRIQANEGTIALLNSDLNKYREFAISMVSRLRDIEWGTHISLRPEATAGICRAYIEHGMAQWPQPVKLCCLGPMFRRERPQKGRYRQFYQIDAEVLGGSDAPGIDAEVIEMVMELFARLELPGVQLEINSIGHAGARMSRRCGRRWKK